MSTAIPDTCAFDYFYVSYLSAGQAAGFTVLKQHKPPDEAPGLDGFNLRGAFQIITMMNQGRPIVILSWHEISERRFNEFQELLQTALNVQNALSSGAVSNVIPFRKEPT